MQRLTTQEAADFLGISRPAMVKLLDQGKIRYDPLGRHRRILVSELLAYVERRGEQRRAALDQMTAEASAAGLYGGRPEEYAAALKKVRKRPAGNDAPMRSRVSGLVACEPADRANRSITRYEV